MVGEQTDAEIDGQVAGALSQRLLGASSTAELAHVVLATIVAIFVWPTVPWSYAGPWAVSVAVVTAGRVRWRRRAAARDLAPATVQRGVRVAVAINGVLWGLGAAWLTLHAPFTDIALLLVVLAGLVAGGMVTLMADPPAFWILLISVLGLPAAGLLASGLDRNRLAASILIAVFGGFEMAVHRRSYAVLVEHEATRAVALRQGEHLRDSLSRVRRAEEAARHSEAQYRSLVEHAVQGIYRSTADGRMVAVNPALVSMLGYGSAEELLRVRARDLYVDPSERERLIARVHDADRIDGTEVTWRRRDGAPIAVRLSGRPVRGTDGAIEGFEMIAEDLTERRTLEEQLRQAQKMEAIGQLAGGVAHDFNNLLTTVLAANELLAEELPSEAHREETDMIRQAARRGADLTAKLLTFCRQQPLERHPLRLQELVAEFTPLARRLVPEDVDIALRVEAPDAVISADPVAIEQILMNLVTNARDAMPAGGTLTVRLARATPGAAAARARGAPGAYALLEVGDTGVGMDTDTARRVFEPFFTTKPVDQHTGLGMAVVYGLVQQHGGFVDLESEVGRGTTVRLYFPAVADIPAEPPRPAAGAVAGGSEVVLLVEDDASLRHATKRVLEKFGYAVITASDGQDALDYMRSAPAAPGLVISDVVMPRVNGPRMWQEMRAAGWQTKVLFTSGYTARDMREGATFDAECPFLPKPWTVTDLLRTIREVLAAPAP